LKRRRKETNRTILKMPRGGSGKYGKSERKETITN